MSNNPNTQLPVEVVHRILKARDALVEGDRDEAYHQLYAIASPGFDKYFPWDEMEKQIGYPKFNEAEIKERREVTAYATKLVEMQRVAVESDKQRKEANDQLREAKKLLNEVFRKHETGLLPDRFIYEKIKKFLYGE